MKKTKLNKTLRKLFKGLIREEMKKEGLLGRFKNKIHKSKKKYTRKNKKWKDEL